MKEAKWEWIERQFINIDKKDYHRMHDADRNLLTASAAALNNWTEYCSDLFNYALRTDRSLKRKLKPVHTKEEVDDAKISRSNDCSNEDAMPNTLVEQNINSRVMIKDRLQDQHISGRPSGMSALPRRVKPFPSEDYAKEASKTTKKINFHRWTTDEPSSQFNMQSD
ncbi:hypothetical protein DPMN_077747 [Dreissena polymorpha]|uniref:Uncharacterized protein n=1 Tax=Dreissena polymorpha TaxID=45954 RepID=A0A9D4BPX2_DREPO|nr:hypothetical protein DPMN_077747 [Dreissena polymorpha]